MCPLLPDNMDRGPSTSLLLVGSQLKFYADFRYHCRTKSLERTRAGHVSCQCGRAGPPASLSSVVRQNYFLLQYHEQRATFSLCHHILHHCGWWSVALSLFLSFIS